MKITVGLRTGVSIFASCVEEDCMHLILYILFICVSCVIYNYCLSLRQRMSCVAGEAIMRYIHVVEHAVPLTPTAVSHMLLHYWVVL